MGFIIALSVCLVAGCIKSAHRCRVERTAGELRQTSGQPPPPGRPVSQDVELRSLQPADTRSHSAETAAAQAPAPPRPTYDGVQSRVGRGTRESLSNARNTTPPPSYATSASRGARNATPPPSYAALPSSDARNTTPPRSSTTSQSIDTSSLPPEHVDAMVRYVAAGGRMLEGLRGNSAGDRRAYHSALCQYIAGGAQLFETLRGYSAEDQEEAYRLALRQATIQGTRA